MGSPAASQSGSELILLSDALRQLKAAKPWAPIASLRQAVADGQIPSKRSSFKKRARYYVRMADLESFLPSQDLPTIKE